MDSTRNKTTEAELSALDVNDIEPLSKTPQLIPDYVQIYLTFILYVVIAGGVSLFGVGANIINVIVFGKQGLQDSSSISLMALTVTDLGVCLCTLLGGVCYAMDRLVTGLNVDIKAIRYLFAAYPRVYFAEMSMCTTVVLSLERCLCVTRPLTFKRFINRQTIVIMLALFYIEIWGIAAALFAMHGLAWKFDPKTNSTKLMLDLKAEPVPEEIFMHHSINNYVLTGLSIFAVLVCTGVMTRELTSSKKFRQESASAHKDQTTSRSNRDVRLVKLVTLISAIFLVCYVPLTTVTAVVTAVREIDAFGSQSNLNATLWGFVWTISALNSSVNIFVYYNVSSNYKRHIYASF